jgi:hypothetical protein
MSGRPTRDDDARRRLASAKLTAHRGLATWGERLVPLGEFRAAAATAGQRLSAAERVGAATRHRRPSADTTPIEGPFERIVVFGGVYNNHLGLAALLDESASQQADAIYCLGDLGGFGPNPEKVRPLLEEGSVLGVQGNYEESLAAGREDCNCGYTDPRDNVFADLSYRYTAERCPSETRRWLGSWPTRRRVRVGGRELLLVHGSPRRINEFLFASTSPVPFLEVLCDEQRCDGFLCTHTGLPWHRRLPSGRDVANVGVIGRPANDGAANVWYATITAGADGLDVRLETLSYDHLALAREMRSEELPEEFVETILTGWWTTCLEVLPAKERAASRF